MKRNDSIIDEVVSSIDDLNDVVTESKLDVIGSLVDSYDKILTLAEEDADYDVTKYTNVFGESYEMDYYQEAKQQEKSFGEKFKERFDEGNILWSIIKFIPNLFKLIIDKVSSLWKKEDESKAKKATQAFKKAGEGAKSVVSKVFDLIIDENGHVKTGFKIGGIAVSTTTLIVFVAIFLKYGKKIAKKFKEFWTGKVPAFFTRRENANSIPDPGAVGNIRYKNNQWIMHVNLEAIIHFFKDPATLIAQVGQLKTYDENAIKTFNECTAAIIEARKLDIASTKKFNYTDDQIDHWISSYSACVNGLKDAAAASLNNINELLNSIKNKGANTPAEGDQSADDKQKKPKKPKLDKNEKEAAAVLEKCVKQLTEYVNIIPPLMKFAKEGVIKPLTDIVSIIQVSSGNLSVSEGLALFKKYAPDATPEEIEELKTRLREATITDPKQLEEGSTENAENAEGSDEDGVEPSSDAEGDIDEDIDPSTVKPKPTNGTDAKYNPNSKELNVVTTEKKKNNKKDDNNNNDNNDANKSEGKGNPVKKVAVKAKDKITNAANKVGEGVKGIFKKKNKDGNDKSGKSDETNVAEYVVSYASENGFTKEETIELFAECARLYGSLLFGDQEFQETYVEEHFCESDGYVDDYDYEEEEDVASSAWYQR